MSDLNNEPNATENANMQANDLKYDTGKVREILTKDISPARSRKKKIIALVAVLIILAAAGYGYKNKWFGTSQDAAYSTVAIGKSTVQDSIEATGTLSPVKQSSMGFKNDDTITAINVQPGDMVKAGQILAQQDPSSLKSALQQAQSTMDQDQITVQTASLTLENNRKTLERQQMLFNAGAISQTDLDTAQNNYTKSKWDLATAQSKLANDQIKVAQAQSDLSAATLTAPFDGIIGAVNGQVGQINGINSSSSTLLTIMSTDLELTALVNEADIGRIKVGQEVEFTSSSYSDRKFKGQVLRITPQASTVSSVQYYPVLISCVDPERKLLSGMSVTANIIIDKKTDVLTVPMMAVSYAQTYLRSNPTVASENNSQTAASANGQKSQTRSGRMQANTPAMTDSQKAAAGSANQSEKSAMVLVLKDNKITVKNVLLGLNDGSNYEVIQGLSEGDQVVVGSDQLDSQSDSSNSSTNSNSNSSKSTRQQGGAPGGMGGPPPGM